LIDTPPGEKRCSSAQKDYPTSALTSYNPLGFGGYALVAKQNTPRFPIIRFEKHRKLGTPETEESEVFGETDLGSYEFVVVQSVFLHHDPANPGLLLCAMH